MTTKGDLFDVLILGGGPAGASAAMALAGCGRSAALFDEPGEPGPTLDWLGPQAVAALESVRLDRKGFCVESLDRLTFASADFRKRTDVHIEGDPALIVDRPRLVESMRSAAKRAGAMVHAEAVETAEVHEERVICADARGRRFVGRMVLAANGPQSAAARRLGWQHQAVHPPIVRMGLHQRRPGGKRRAPRSAIAQLTMVLDFAGQPSTGLILTGTFGTAVSLLAEGERGGVARQLSAFVEQAKAAGFLPESEVQPAAAAVEMLLETPALEMDTHMVKRGLLIGPAGGFACPLSGEELWPAIRSGQLAAVAVDEALRAAMSQDALACFDRLWRTEMAPSLRWPQTDLQLVLPLVFSNQPMAERLARDLVFGVEL